MSLYYVSTDETLGRKVDADSPEAAAQQAAPELGVAAGVELHVRWDVRLHPRDPSTWLFASIREVTARPEWVGATPAPRAAPAASQEAPAVEAPAASPEAPAASPEAPAASPEAEAPAVSQEAPAPEAAAPEAAAPEAAQAKKKPASSRSRRAKKATGDAEEA